MGMSKISILDSPKKAVAVSIVALVAIFAVWLIVRLSRNKIAELKSRSEQKKALNEEIAIGGGLTYGDSDYLQFANTLYYAMKGAGTNEKAVYNVFKKMKTRADVMKLISVYGIRDGETLTEWLYGDFSNMKKINSILSENGIDYLF